MCALTAFMLTCSSSLMHLMYFISTPQLAFETRIDVATCGAAGIVGRPDRLPPQQGLGFRIFTMFISYY